MDGRLEPSDDDDDGQILVMVRMIKRMVRVIRMMQLKKGNRKLR